MEGSYVLFGITITQEVLITLCIAIIAYAIFTIINILGVESAATFELIVTVIAVLALFYLQVFLPEFKLSNISNALPNGYWGVFAAIPFAMWFFLAIECLANVAEETINPQKNGSGFGSAIFTLVLLCILTFSSSVGVGGWEKVVYKAGEAQDSPLPMAVESILGKDHFIYTLLIGIGLIGLIASFHGIVFMAGRATFEFGRVGYALKFLGRYILSLKPANALVINALIGLIALLSGEQVI